MHEGTSGDATVEIRYVELCKEDAIEVWVISELRQINCIAT